MLVNHQNCFIALSWQTEDALSAFVFNAGTGYSQYCQNVTIKGRKPDATSFFHVKGKHGGIIYISFEPRGCTLLFKLNL